MFSSLEVFSCTSINVSYSHSHSQSCQELSSSSTSDSDSSPFSITKYDFSIKYDKTAILIVIDYDKIGIKNDIYRQSATVLLD